jgi:hypothetical protein
MTFASILIQDAMDVEHIIAANAPYPFLLLLGFWQSTLLRVARQALGLGSRLFVEGRAENSAYHVAPLDGKTTHCIQALDSL